MKKLWYLTPPETDLGNVYPSKQEAIDAGMRIVGAGGKRLYILEITAHCAVEPVTVPEIRPIKGICQIKEVPKTLPSYCPECLEELAKKEYREGDEWITIHSCPRCHYEEMGVE